MKKNLFIILPILIISLMACAQTKKTTAKTSVRQPDFEHVLMKRTPCFGKCPIYTVELFKNGRLLYTGMRFVKDSGAYEKNIGAAAAQRIFDEFRKYRVDTCSEQYDMPVADLPGIYYTYTINGEERKIVNANFGPAFLKLLAQKMDEIGYTDIDHSKWKKVTMEN